MKAYSILRGSALIAFVLLTSSLIFSARTSSAETLSSQTQQQLDLPSKGTLGETIAVEEGYVVPPAPYVAVIPAGTLLPTTNVPAGPFYQPSTTVTPPNGWGYTYTRTGAAQFTLVGTSTADMPGSSVSFP